MYILMEIMFAFQYTVLYRMEKNVGLKGGTMGAPSITGTRVKMCK